MEQSDPDSSGSLVLFFLQPRRSPRELHTLTERARATPELRRACAKAAGFRCGYCGGKAPFSPQRNGGVLRFLFPTRVGECDHDIPVARNGTSDWDNLVWACKPCNRVKGVKTGKRYKRWLKVRPWVRVAHRRGWYLRGQEWNVGARLVGAVVGAVAWLVFATWKLGLSFKGSLVVLLGVFAWTALPKKWRRV